MAQYKSKIINIVIVVIIIIIIIIINIYIAAEKSK